MSVVWRCYGGIGKESRSEDSCQSLGATAYYGDDGGEFRAVEAATGRTIWSQRLVEKHQSHAVVDGVAYVSSINRLFAFDADFGAGALDQGSAVRWLQTVFWLWVS